MFRIRRFPSVVCVLLLPLSGACNHKTQPLQSHDHPVTYWLQELKSQDPKARKKAVTALGHVGKADPAAIPALIDALHDGDAGVRDASVLALLNLGSDAKEARPALTEATNDKDATVRDHAAKALEKIRQ
ncbi:MAG TPA: HEAT repeat domain-containing protein [Gemmataceae bacterium]|nr:HEAT repeat domain-containing protein [Gemmataceae bacterium]